ncbi:hypothetical protein R50071_44900 [Halioxenophilus aromaticivorans]
MHILNTKKPAQNYVSTLNYFNSIVIFPNKMRTQTTDKNSSTRQQKKFICLIGWRWDCEKEIKSLNLYYGK